MTVVDKVLSRLEKKKERQGKSQEEKQREAEIWEMENWLIGTGNVRRRRKPRP